MEDITNRKCPNCMAPLVFDGKTQRMTCEYCGSSYSLEELKKIEEEERKASKKESSAEDRENQEKKEARDIEREFEIEPEGQDQWDPKDWQTSDMAGMKVLSCPSCAAEVMVEDTAGATKCPYCDNVMIMPKEFSGMYQPDYVIPFKKTKKEALEAMKGLYLKKPLLPKVFKDQGHLEEIKAVYVPFWLFDLDAHGDFQYEGLRTRAYSDKRYDYVEEKFFDVRRSGKMKFVRIPVDGSEKIDDTMMESIEPYDYSEIKPFELSYLSGYMANKYDVQPEALEKRIEERMKQSVKHYFMDSAEGYESLRPLRQEIKVTKHKKVAYGLFPVWFLTTEWNGKRYAFAMNGQTGKMVGDLPIAKDLVWNYWIMRHIPLTFIMTMVLFLLRVMGVI